MLKVCTKVLLCVSSASKIDSVNELISLASEETHFEFSLESEKQIGTLDVLLYTLHPTHEATAK